MTKKAISIDELLARVAEDQIKEDAQLRGLDPVREARMAELREKYPEGLRAIVHPTRNARKNSPHFLR